MIGPCDRLRPNKGTTYLNPAEKLYRKRALFSFSLFHFLDDGFSDCIYLLLPFITAELGLSFTMVGVLRGTSSISTGVFQVPLSLLGERIGEVTVLAIGTFGMALGFLFLSRAFTFLTILFSLLLGKLTGAGQHGLSSSALSKIFENSGRRAAMGTYNFSGDLGRVCVPFLLTLMINRWGWRDAVFTLSIGGLLVSGFLYFFVSKGATTTLVSVSPPQSSGPNHSKGLGWKVGSKKRFFALLTIGIIDIAARYSLLTFLPFLLLRKGIAVTEFGFALTLLFAGGAAGKFVCGILAEWAGVLPMVMGTEILTTVGILSLTVLPPVWIWVMLPFLGIVLNGTSSVLYATVAEIIPPESRSRGYGIYYAVTLGSGALSPLVFGLLTDAVGLTFTLVITALMLLVTLPLCRFISPKGSI
mgnify:CR=1 FL=1